MSTYKPPLFPTLDCIDAFRKEIENAHERMDITHIAKDALHARLANLQTVIMADAIDNTALVDAEPTFNNISCSDFLITARKSILASMRHTENALVTRKIVNGTYLRRMRVFAKVVDTLDTLN